MPCIKTMKCLPIFLALLLVAGAARAEKLKERFEKTLPLKAGARVELENVNGPVTFEAWDRAEVRIEAEKWAESSRSDVAKKVLSQIRIQVSQTPGGLKIETKMPRDQDGFMDWLMGKSAAAGANYRIRVPRQAVIAAANVNGDLTLRGTRAGARLVNVNGAIAVNAVQGDVNAETVNGKIALTGLDGGVKATTVNGGIEAELAEISRDTHFETVNGGVAVRMPASSRLNLDASMVHGAVQSDFKVAGPSGKKKNILKGTVNGGGSKMTIRTVNGTIEISGI
jgi:Putative adhesin